MRPSIEPPADSGAQVIECYHWGDISFGKLLSSRQLQTEWRRLGREVGGKVDLPRLEAGFVIISPQFMGQLSEGPMFARLLRGGATKLAWRATGTSAAGGSCAPKKLVDTFPIA